ncbi:hypothetical protein SAMN02910356_01868 [Selenomonas sp. GACV-9]|uniref:AEC family transporter n=1 Tax=Selenomonas sp. GACV-9 TaxID=3158782 RepID=UPI0008E00D42|nr:hypothetical protein SAMN02910356_01868 [Selenomonas ruminantium]
MNLRILFVFTDLLLPLLAGWYLHERQLVSDTAMNKVIRFNVVFVYTVLSLLSFWVLPLSWGLLLVPVFGFLLVLLPGLLGYLLFARRIDNLLDRGAYVASAMLANLGTLGGVCAFILYNEEGFAYTQLIGTCQNILLCLLIFPLAQYYHLKHTAARRKTSGLQSLRAMFFSLNQLSLVGMMAGFALNAAGIERPEALAPLFQSLVHIGAWIAMLPVGFLIDFDQVRHYARQTRSLVALRFLFTPLLFVGLTWLFVTDPVISGTLILLAFCPTAINAVLTSKLYALSVGLAISSFVITTAAFLLVIFPLLFFLLK